jgi:hypothetical protein
MVRSHRWTVGAILLAGALVGAASSFTPGNAGVGQWLLLYATNLIPVLVVIEVWGRQARNAPGGGEAEKALPR